MLLAWQLRYLGWQTLPADLSTFGIERFFTFADANLAAIQSRYKDELRLGAALQIGFLQMTGLGLLGGLRIESTHASYAANAFNGDTNTLIGLNTKDSSYSNAFPTIQARYEIDSQTILRGAISSAMHARAFRRLRRSYPRVLRPIQFRRAIPS